MKYGITTRGRRCLVGTLVITALYGVQLLLGPFPSLRRPSWLHTTSGSAASSLPYPDVDADPWRPYVLRHCIPGSHPEFAPCRCQQLALENCAYGEELVYPDFELRLPETATDSSRDKFKALLQGQVKGRAELFGDWAVYKGQHGQNYVFRHATFTSPDRYDSWSSRGAVGTATSPTDVRSARNLTENEAQDQLLIANVPDSWSFQHFLDRSTRIVAQAHHLFDRGPNVTVKAVVGGKPQDGVAEMWRLLGISELLNSPGYATAGTILWSNRAVLVHPYLSRRAIALFGLDALDNTPGEESPSDEVVLQHSLHMGGGQNVIMYVSRSLGGTMNGGRTVLNEEEILLQLAELADSRSKNEEFMIFDRAIFPTQFALMSFFRRRVKLLVGPHGGGLMNHRWMKLDGGSGLVEFIPTNWPAVQNFEECRSLGQEYGAIVTEPESDTDMRLDVDEVVQLVSAVLERLDEKAVSEDHEVIRRVYPWQG